jgi:hypothetical protein
VQLYTLSKTSLAKTPSSATELYIPLWVADGTYVQTTVNGPAFSCLTDGGTIGNPGSVVFNLSPNWSASQQYALEVTLSHTGGTATAYAALWDNTSNSLVSASQIATNNTTLGVVRSGKFTLIPGHAYKVSVWTSDATQYAQIADAFLVVFGS